MTTILSDYGWRITMKIKKIKLENNNFFGNTTFDFTNENGEIMDTIILAGENGNGKTQLIIHLSYHCAGNNSILLYGNHLVILCFHSFF